jgi:hypothetical protein
VPRKEGVHRVPQTTYACAVPAIFEAAARTPIPALVTLGASRVRQVGLLSMSTECKSCCNAHSHQAVASHSRRLLPLDAMFRPPLNALMFLYIVRNSRISSIRLFSGLAKGRYINLSMRGFATLRGSVLSRCLPVRGA